MCTRCAHKARSATSSMFKALFDDRKATHAAAYMLHLGGGSLGILKLMKLMYMAEKLSYHRYGEPLIGDEPYSLKDGPILSAVYDRAKGSVPPNSIWASLIKDRHGNEIALVDLANVLPALGSLSEADTSVMDAIWKKFGHMTGPQLRDYTHKFPEWENPLDKKVKRLSIRREKLLMSVGFSQEEAAELKKNLQEAAAIEAQFCAA